MGDGPGLSSGLVCHRGKQEGLSGGGGSCGDGSRGSLLALKVEGLQAKEWSKL